TQRRRRVDPVAVPAGRAQLRIHVVRVVAALAGDDRIALLEVVDAVGVFEFGLVSGERRRVAARIAGAEKHRFDQIEVAFLLHTLHQDAADHAAPTYETYVHDFIPLEWTLPRKFARRDRAGKTGGHDGRSAFRDRFRGNRFNRRLDGNGEF